MGRARTGWVLALFAAVAFAAWWTVTHTNTEQWPEGVASSLPLNCKPFVGRFVNEQGSNVRFFGWRFVDGCAYPDGAVVVCSHEGPYGGYRFCSQPQAGSVQPVLGYGTADYYDRSVFFQGELILGPLHEGAPRTARIRLTKFFKERPSQLEEQETQDGQLEFRLAAFVAPTSEAHLHWKFFQDALHTLAANRKVTIWRLRDWVEAGQPRDAQQVALLARHDVCHDMFAAHKMAWLEHELGINATYMIFGSGEYAGLRSTPLHAFRDDLMHLPRDMQRMGHEMGLHNDVLAIAYYFGASPRDELTHELDFFRQQGLDIVGSASHGYVKRGPEPQGGWFNNYHLFSELKPETLRTIASRDTPKTFELATFSHQEFGLRYEAYNLGHDIYYTDIGPTKGLWSFGGRPQWQHLAQTPSRFDASLITQLPGGTVVQLLTHPMRWGRGETFLPFVALRKDRTEK